MYPRKRREPVAFAIRVVLYALYGVPLLWIVLTSLKSSRDIFTSQATVFFTPTLEAYSTALADPALASSMRQSAIIAVGTTSLVLFCAVPAAYALARAKTRLVVGGLAVLVLLQMIPQTASLIPLYWLLNSTRLLDTNVGLILADSTLFLPWAILLMRPFFARIPISIEEASLLDGARTLRAFFAVALPLARNGVLVVTSVILLVSWGEFLYGVTFMLSPRNYPMSALIAQQSGLYGINWPGMMAFGVIAVIPVFILYIASYRLLRNGLTLGAVK
ncbi:MAG: hypothetical protein CVT64_03730 [Actinobacteria bacterium HGW-Actinobacteria-4]|nr:MAG: hypothetical protein CVT64_03730 [Actinobacteria bacterium HGW-Actinobacteria-4]